MFDNTVCVCGCVYVFYFEVYENLFRNEIYFKQQNPH